MDREELAEKEVFGKMEEGDVKKVQRLDARIRAIDDTIKKLTYQKGDLMSEATGFWSKAAKKYFLLPGRHYSVNFTSREIRAELRK